jgi:ABC-type transport system involved in multi-copper enzyme maturation permease subunit
LVGPLFWYEVTRQTRRGHGTLLRCLFVVVILVGTYFFYAQRFPVNFRQPSFDSPGTVSQAGGARFAMNYFFFCMYAQAIALMLVTPSYVATAIAEEKERGTIELLFTTFVTSREVVLGKLCGRLLHLAAFLLAGMPVLCLTLLWGGLSLEDILLGYAVLLVTLLSVGSLSIFCSVTARSVLGAELSSYGLVIVFYLVLLVVCGFLGKLAKVDLLAPSSPIAFFAVWQLRFEQADRPFDAIPLERMTLYGWFIATLILNLLVALFFLPASWLMLRSKCLAETDRNRRQPGHTAVVRLRRKQPIPKALLVEAVPAVLPVEEIPPEEPPLHAKKLPRKLEIAQYRRHYKMVPVGSEALLWKEMHHGTTIANPEQLRALRWVLLIGVLAFSLLLAPLHLATWVEQASWSGHGAASELSGWLNALLRLGALFCMIGWCGAVGLRTANTLSRERSQQTLLGLLTLPVPRRDILRSKWWGSILRYQWTGWLLLAAVVAGLVSGMIHPLLLPVLAIAFVCHLTFLASFGLWLSLMVRSQFSVQLCMSLVVVMMCAAPLLLALYAPDAASLAERQTLWYQFKEVGASPVNSWWFLMSGWQTPDQRFWMALIGVVIGAVLYGVAGFVLWKGACFLFDKLQGDEVAGRK